MKKTERYIEASKGREQFISVYGFLHCTLETDFDFGYFLQEVFLTFFSKKNFSCRLTQALRF
jgi:hypothetical protein